MWMQQHNVHYFLPLLLAKHFCSHFLMETDPTKVYVAWKKGPKCLCFILATMRVHVLFLWLWVQFHRNEFTAKEEKNTWLPWLCCSESPTWTQKGRKWAYFILLLILVGCSIKMFKLDLSPPSTDYPPQHHALWICLELLCPVHVRLHHIAFTKIKNRDDD